MFQRTDITEERRRAEFLRRRERSALLAYCAIGLVGSATIALFLLLLTLHAMLGSLDHFGKPGLFLAAVAGAIVSRRIVRSLYLHFEREWENALRCRVLGDVRVARLSAENAAEESFD